MIKSLILLTFGTVLCGAHLPDAEQNKQKHIFHPNNKRYYISNRNHGSFNINDGPLVGAGLYEVEDDGVEIDLKLKLALDKNPLPFPYAPGPSPPVGPSSPATSSPPPPPPSPGGSSSPATSSPPPPPPSPGGSSSPAASSPGVDGSKSPSPTETTSSPGNKGPGDEQEALALHNKFRKIHDAPPMTLNEEMSKSAAAYAAKLAQMQRLTHSNENERQGHGENLAKGCSTNKGETPTEAVTDWYDEVCNKGYTFGSESMGGSGHFTQLVWKGSVELGFGRADSEQNGMKCSYYVARYKPAGNMMGEFVANVAKGSFDKNYCNTIKRSLLPHQKTL